MLDIQPPDFSASMPANMVELQPPGLVQHLVILFIFLLPLFVFALVIIFLFKIIISKSSHLYMKKAAGVLLMIIFSIVIVFQSLYLPKTINDPNQQNLIKCGAPFPFLSITSYSNPPLPSTQSCIGWMGSPMDTPKKFLWEAFFMNVGIYFGLNVGIFYSIKFIYQNVFKVKKKNDYTS